MKRVIVAAILITLMAPCLAFSQSWWVEGKGAFLNPSKSIDQRSLSNREMTLHAYVPLNVTIDPENDAVRQNIVAFMVHVRATSNEFAGPPSAGFIGFQINPNKAFGLELGGGLTSVMGPGRDRFRARAAVSIDYLPLHLYIEGETGGDQLDGTGDSVYWNALLSVELPNKWIAVGIAAESNIGLGPRIDIPIPGVPATFFLAYLYGQGYGLGKEKRFGSDFSNEKVWLGGARLEFN